jgi:hypothetical protein
MCSIGVKIKKTDTDDTDGDSTVALMLSKLTLNITRSEDLRKVIKQIFEDGMQR